ncbi:putative transcriptional regulator, partial [human gut metagenome]
HDISNPFFTEAARGIEDRLRQDGRVPMVGSTDSDPDRERELMSMLAGLDVCGVIVTPSAFTLDNLAVLACCITIWLKAAFRYLSTAAARSTAKWH